MCQKDQNKIKDLEEKGLNVIYGNGASADVLKKAGIKDARAAVLSISYEHDLYISARTIRKMNPQCYILAKVHTERALKKLKKEKLIDDHVWPEKKIATEISEKVIKIIKD